MNYPGKYADVPALSNIVFGLAWVRNTMVLAPHVTKEFTYCMYCAAPELTRICTSRKWLAKSLIELGLGHGQRLLFFIMITSRLRRLVLCILHFMFFAKEKNKNATKNNEGSLADICDDISRDYIVAFP